jgi:hypothetical protein
MRLAAGPLREAAEIEPIAAAGIQNDVIGIRVQHPAHRVKQGSTHASIV